MDPFANVPIVVPIDFSEEADRAVEFALEVASSATKIHAIHVCPSLAFYEPAAVVMLPEDETREQYQEAFSKRYAASKFRGLHFDVRFGDAGTQIVSFAAEVGAALIVMPSHGRTGLAHLLIGSVAERVVRLAPCAVLVLRG